MQTGLGHDGAQAVEAPTEAQPMFLALLALATLDLLPPWRESHRVDATSGVAPPPPNTGDTADTGDTSDTADTGDTSDTADTGDTSDTGDTADTGDSADTADTGDSADTGDTAPYDPGTTAAERNQETGGCGCASHSHAVLSLAAGSVAAGFAFGRRSLDSRVP